MFSTTTMLGKVNSIIKKPNNIKLFSTQTITSKNPIPNYIKNLQKTVKTSHTRLRQLSQFHSGKGVVHKTLTSLTKELKKQEIDYAIIGGLAVYHYGYERTTNDIDLIIREEDFKKFEDYYKNGKIFDYRLKSGNMWAKIGPFSKYKWVDKITKVNIDLISTAENLKNGLIVPFPDPKETEKDKSTGIYYIKLHHLISLKLGAYKEQGLYKRGKDQVDVIELIKHLKLPIKFADLLHPEVRDLFIEIQTNLAQSKPSRFN
jgi:hypothetical protein